MSTAAIVGLAFGVAMLASQEARAQLSTYLVPDSALTDEKFAAAIYESREWTHLELIPSGPR